MAEIEESILDGDVVRLQKFISQEERWDFNSRFGKDNMTLLHWACHLGSVEVVQWLLWKGANPNEIIKHGWLCSHLAAIRGHGQCLEALLIYKCDLSTSDDKGYTCLHLAAAHGRTKCVELLLRFGIDARITDMRGWTAAHHAAYHGRLQSLMVLKKFVAPLHDPDVNGSTPAHLAAQEGHLACLQLLMLSHENIQVVLDTKNDEGDTPKTLALYYQKQDCVDYLSEVEKNVNLPDFYHKNDHPAHMAAFHGNLSHLILLIEEGHCGINDQDMWGATPAHKAAGNGRTECLQWLIDNGADMFIRNKNSETPKDIARKFGRLDCLALLGGDAEALEGSQDEEESDSVVAEESKERAEKRVEDLLALLEIAKGHLKQFGGVSRDDLQRQKEAEEHQCLVKKLLGDLDRERVRREQLEMEVDKLRLKLHQSQEKLFKLEELMTGRQATNCSSSNVKSLQGDRETKNGPIKSSKRVTPDLNKGAFVKIVKT